MEKGQNISQNILGHLFKCLLSLKTLAQTGAEKFIIEFIFGEKERANKWNDKQYMQNSLIHSATCHTQTLFQISNT